MNRRDFLKGAASVLAGAAAAAVVGVQPAMAKPIPPDAIPLNFYNPPLVLMEGVVYEMVPYARHLITEQGVGVEIWYDMQVVYDPGA